MQRESRKARQAASRPYRFLPLFRVFLWLLAGFCVLGGMVLAVRLLLEDSIWLALGALAVTALVAIPYLAAAEAITLLLGMAVQQENMLAMLQRAAKTREGE